VFFVVVGLVAGYTIAWAGEPTRQVLGWSVAITALPIGVCPDQRKCGRAVIEVGVVPSVDVVALEAGGREARVRVLTVEIRLVTRDAIVGTGRLLERFEVRDAVTAGASQVAVSPEQFEVCVVEGGCVTPADRAVAIGAIGRVAACDVIDCYSRLIIIEMARNAFRFHPTEGASHVVDVAALTCGLPVGTRQRKGGHRMRGFTVHIKEGLGLVASGAWL